MDKDTIKRLNRIIDNTVGNRIPLKYIKTFIITDEDEEVSLSRDEFYELLEEIDDDISVFEVTYILDYKKIRKDIKTLVDKILEE